MGCCSCKNVDSKASRFTRWRSTGIVALCDSKLKMVGVGNNITDVDADDDADLGIS